MPAKNKPDTPTLAEIRQATKPAKTRQAITSNSCCNSCQASPTRHVTRRAATTACNVLPVAMAQATQTLVILKSPLVHIKVRLDKKEPRNIPSHARLPDQSMSATASPAAGNIGLA